MSRQFAGARQQLRPHAASASLLRSQAEIYRSGRTPVVDEGGVRAWDIAPATVLQTAQQLDEIRRNFGGEGLRQSVRGLAITRGSAFTAAAVRGTAARDGADPGDLRSEEAADGRDVAQALRASTATKPLPHQLDAKLARPAGYSFAKVRVHDDPSAHRAATLLNARAFTIGNDVYLGRGEYRPESEAGQRLLAHEAAHTVQQRGTAVPAALETLSVSRPGDHGEVEAECFADWVLGSRSTGPRLTPASAAGVARIQRAISFTRGNDVFNDANTMTVNPTAAGFQARPSATPLFSWTADVTIHGNAGDPFGNFEVGPLQVVREKWMNIYWGTGADRTHRNVHNSAKPARDVAGASVTWYSDWRASPTFGASGDLRTTTLADSPQRDVQPWTNPIATRGGTRGWFNYGMAFVGYISARDRTAGTAAAAYRPTGNVYWNFGIDGHWNNADPVATRMVTTGGTVNHSRAFNGGSGEFPSMHGGTSSHDLEVTTTT